MFYVFLTGGIICAVSFLVRRGPKVTAGIVIHKAVTSVLFILTAAFAFLCNSSAPGLFSMLVISGGICGLLGDIWLDLKYVYPADNKTFLNAGFSSFLVGHIFFSAAILTLYSFKWYHYLIGLGSAVLIAFFTAFSENLLGVFYKEFKKLTVVYMGFLGLAVGLSVSAMLSSHFSAASIVFLVGIVLFLASDAVLSGIYFGEGKVRKFDITLNHALYYSAQFLIASSIIFMK